MHVSPIFKSSTRCRPSPDGKLIATWLSHALVVRSAESLETVHEIPLSSDLVASVSSVLLWSPTSTKILVAVPGQVHLFSVVDHAFHAEIRDPVPGASKPPQIAFGVKDSEVLLWHPFGMKLVIFDMSTSAGVEVMNPKFYLPSSVSRGYSIRQQTGHLALLARTGGRDIVSIHHPVTRAVQVTWHPESIDAHGLVWSEDGQWLVVWESAAQGHKLLLFTPDGQIFRVIGSNALATGADTELNPGIKLCASSPDSRLFAVADYTRTVVLLEASGWKVRSRISHPTTIVPKDTLQLWQEELSKSSAGDSVRSFSRANRHITPAVYAQEAKAASEAKGGCATVAFDASSHLLATKLEDVPHIVWIWDLHSAELRAVLWFHLNVTFVWHPSIKELLLVTCLDNNHQDTCFIWDPLSQGPNPISTTTHMSKSKEHRNCHVEWLANSTETTPLLFLSDSSRWCLLSCLASPEDGNPWKDANSWKDAEGGYRGYLLSWNDSESAGLLEDATNLSLPAPEDVTLEDTFSFRKP